MPQFLIIYRSPTSPAEMFATASPGQQRSFIRAWRAWSDRVGNALVDPGTLVQSITDPGADGNGITGYAIVSAEDPDQVDRLLAEHPYLRSGGSAGIYQLLTT